MRRVLSALAVAAQLCAGTPTLPEAEALLAKADAVRNPWPAFQVDIGLTFKGQAQRWHVAVAPNRDVRVDGRSDKEKGRTVLMLGEDMWLLLPDAKRPVRVTPQQRLLGPAAGGDLARTSLAGEYTVTRCTEDPQDGRPALRLDLEARRPSLTYRTIRLWLAPGSGHPLRAEYLMASGKLARTATFDPPGQAHGRAVLLGMTLTEPKGGATRFQFDHWEPSPAPADLFKLPPIR